MGKCHAFCLMGTERFCLFCKECLTRNLSSCLSVSDLVSSLQLLGKGLVPYHLNLEKGQTSLKFAGHFMFSAILTQFPSIYLNCLVYVSINCHEYHQIFLVCCYATDYVFIRLWACQFLNPFSDVREIRFMVAKFSR